MTDAELDIVYTRLCQTMTELGEANASLFLARFAMLPVPCWRMRRRRARF